MKIIWFIMVIAMFFGLGVLWYLSFDVLRSCSYVLYESKDVRYHNPETGLYISGTLTLPYTDRPTAAIVLVSGTGKHDRDCTSKGHKIFYAIADYLTHRGIAVLRYDKRGVGQSQGLFDTTLTTADFASDARASFNYLKTRVDIDSTKIGLLGHSEGGLIVSMLASEIQDVKFVISMAGAATTTIDNIVKQAGMQIIADGGSQDIVTLDQALRTQILQVVSQEYNKDLAKIKLDTIIDTYLDAMTPDQVEQVESLAFETSEKDFEPQAPVYVISRLNKQRMIDLFNSNWVRFLLQYNPLISLTHIKAPVLAVNGSLDFIVSACVTLPIWLQGLLQGCNQDISIVQMPGLNHWFQPCQTGSLREYGQTDVDVSLDFLRLLAGWIHDKIR